MQRRILVESHSETPAITPPNGRPNQNMAGMKTIIGLAFMLAIGILLVILSCALYGYVMDALL